ncbi:hypothetical protein G6011_01049 [Alternaria panax]|uniref:Uncharacterized protein n=1 Tax=Alternaria panax TaxID=48097 RepID=A0AAD4IK70_9PLEO|nr:hypothetical protein G6011_01049 [Alternaria panax]
MPPNQRTADPALKQARTAQGRPILPSAKRSDRIQDTYPAYDDFPWSEIEEYLKDICPPGWKFKEKRSHDKWLFELPQELTETDRTALRNKRDASGLSRGPSVSPEPEPGQNSAS